MIVDTSAIMAVLLGESDAVEMIDALFDTPDRKVSAGTWIELSAVIARHRIHGVVAAFESLAGQLHLQIVPVSVRQAEIGLAGYRIFGRGADHKAHLNFGDCFAYALARETGEALLYKGDDFGHTDVTSALA